jgi:hypothetical protein
MVMTEAEKASRSSMEQTFYTKLGPTPAFATKPVSSRAGETGDTVILVAVARGAFGWSDRAR